MPTTIISYFNDIDDPRTGNATRHKFCDIMTISLLCALCGGETSVDMADFGLAKEDFLREFLELPHGTPCHDTFSRVFRLIKPASFQKFFDKFRADFAQERDVQPAIAIDGNRHRRSRHEREYSNLRRLNGRRHPNSTIAPPIAGMLFRMVRRCDNNAYQNSDQTSAVNPANPARRKEITEVW